MVNPITFDTNWVQNVNSLHSFCSSTFPLGTHGDLWQAGYFLIPCKGCRSLRLGHGVQHWAPLASFAAMFLDGFPLSPVCSIGAFVRAFHHVYVLAVISEGVHQHAFCPRLCVADQRCVVAVTGVIQCEVWFGFVQALCKVWLGIVQAVSVSLVQFLSFLTWLSFSWNSCGKAHMDFEVKMPLRCFIVPSNRGGH